MKWYNWTLILILLIGGILLLLHYSEQSLERSYVTYFNDNITLYSTPNFDFCKLIDYNSCPSYFEINEDFYQTIYTSIKPNRAILKPGDVVNITINTNVTTPIVELYFVPEVFGDRFVFNHTISNFDNPGPGQLYGIDESVPISTILNRLGLELESLTADIVDKLVSINGDFDTNSYIIMNTGGNGFIGAKDFDLNSPTIETAQLSFNGTRPIQNLSINYNTEQGVYLNLTFRALLIADKLYNTTMRDYLIGSYPNINLAWYRINVSSTKGGQVKINNSTAWYEENYKLKLQAEANSSYAFYGFYTGNLLISNSSTYTYNVTGPANIIAVFSKSSSGISDIIYAIIIVIAVIFIAGYLVHQRRKRNHSSHGEDYVQNP